MNEYRYIVRVSTTHHTAVYAREVTIEGPQPEDAVKKALDAITKDGDDDLWQQDDGKITWERVR